MAVYGRPKGPFKQMLTRRKVCLIMKRAMMGILAALVVVAALVLFLDIGGGDIRNVQRTIGESTVYTPAEINRAMNVVERHFRRHFAGCTLTELVYDESVSNKEADDWAEQYGAREAIVLTSSFDVDGSGRTVTLNPNSTYTRWQWVLTRNGIGGWRLRDWGY